MVGVWYMHDVGWGWGLFMTLGILKRRLAAGEISVAQYDDLRRALDRPVSASPRRVRTSLTVMLER